MAIQVDSSAAEVVSFPVTHTCSNFPPSLCPKSNIQVTGMLPAATRNRHKGQIIYVPETESSAHSFCGIPLFYHFPPHIPQNELIVIGVWSRVKKQNQTKGHRWQRYNITAKAGECGTILGLPGFM